MNGETTELEFYIWSHDVKEQLNPGDWPLIPPSRHFPVLSQKIYTKGRGIKTSFFLLKCFSITLILKTSVL